MRKSLARWAGPNNAFKPTPHRGANHMAGTACHVLHAPLRRGLTWVLGLMGKNHSGLLAFGAIPLWLALSVPLALLAVFANPLIPRLLGFYLFFGPQFLFSFSQVVTPVPGGYAPLFQPWVAAVVCAALWLAVTIAYGCAARNWPTRRTLMLGLVVVLAVAFLTHFGFSAFGYRVQLDGP